MLRITLASRILILALTLFSALVSAPKFSLASEAIVTDVRVGPRGKATRVVFDLSNSIAVKLFTLSDPYRMVIDLPEVGWQLPQKPLPTRIGVFDKLRYGLFRPGNSRVVIDLDGPALVESAFLLKPHKSNSYRLVVDLTRASTAAYAELGKGKLIKIDTVTSETIKRPKAVATIRPSAKQPKVARIEAPVVANPVNRQARFQLPPRKPALRQRPEKRIVVIDPGHGGVDPGTISVNGIYEKHITLAMARTLKTMLEKTGRYEARVTRNRDIFIPLKERVQYARDAKAHLFISIHADTVKNHNTRGASVYTLSERASDKEAAALAEKENKADTIAGIDLTGESQEVTNILIDLAQRESMNQSARFAETLVKRLRKKTRILRNTHRFAGFAVLKAPDIPSILLELGFLSNKTDERQLRSKSHREKLAVAIVEAMNDYFVRIEEASR